MKLSQNHTSIDIQIERIIEWNYQQIQFNMLKQSTLAFVIKKDNQMVVYKLPKKIQGYQSASNSVILSLSSFLVHEYPRMPHPQYLDFKLPDIVTQQNFPNSTCWLHPMIQPWTDLLSDSVMEGNAVRQQETLYIQVIVDKDYQIYLKGQNFIRQVYSMETHIEQIFQLGEKIEKSENKIALVNFAVSQLRKDKIQPKIHIPALLLGIFYNNQKWNYYPILKGEIPSSQQIAEHDVIILPGSTYSVFDRVPEIVKFVQNFGPAYKINQNLRVMAICFGHQVICDYYKTPIARKDRYQGQQKVKFIEQTIEKYSFLKPLAEYGNKSYLMPQHHQDYVNQVPEGFDLLGESQSCKIQSVISHDGRIFSMQYHPEYYSEYADIFVERQKNYKGHCQSGHMSFSLGIENERAATHHESCDVVRKSIALFLQGK